VSQLRRRDQPNISGIFNTEAQAIEGSTQGTCGAGAMPESAIDTSDVPEIRELPSDAVVGRFYRPKKNTVTMRLDTDVLAWLKASGEGYQTRINAYLRELMYRRRPRRRAKESAEIGRVRQPLTRRSRPRRAHR